MSPSNNIYDIFICMKVCFKGLNKYFSVEEIEAIKRFIEYLQTGLSLSKDVHIHFLHERKNKMTTGVRLPHHLIQILAHDRLLVDTMRTLAHEWVHEYQHQKMGLKDTDKTQDIGGPHENMANVLAGIFMKKFQNDYPEYEDVMYGED